MNLKGRSLSNLLDISQSEFFSLLELAHKVKKEKKDNIFPKRLTNKNIALIFEKSSYHQHWIFHWYESIKLVVTIL